MGGFLIIMLELEHIFSDSFLNIIGFLGWEQSYWSVIEKNYCCVWKSSEKCGTKTFMADFYVCQFLFTHFLALSSFSFLPSFPLLLSVIFIQIDILKKSWYILLSAHILLCRVNFIILNIVFCLTVFRWKWCDVWSYVLFMMFKLSQSLPEIDR